MSTKDDNEPDETERSWRKTKIRAKDEEKTALRTHSNGLEVNISSGYLKARVVRTNRTFRQAVRKLASKEVPKMDSFTKDMIYEGAMSRGKRRVRGAQRRRGGAKTGKV